LNSRGKITFGFFRTRTTNLLGDMFYKFSDSIDLVLDSGWTNPTRPVKIFGKETAFRALSPMTGCTEALGD